MGALEVSRHSRVSVSLQKGCLVCVLVIVVSLWGSCVRFGCLGDPEAAAIGATAGASGTG